MQARFIALGYPTWEADGVYGKLTLRAVRLFQGDAGLKESKTVTSELLAVLYSEDAPTYVRNKSLKFGSRGERVRILQERLLELGYYTGEIDGKYGSGTMAAVSAFQTAAGYDATGTADKDTLKLLYSSRAPSI